MKKIKSPFKDINQFKIEIFSFLKLHKATIANQANKISQYFEMSAYNSIVKYYETNGYKVTIKNLVDNKFRYKLSPTGYPFNFSYFEVSKIYYYKKNIKKYFFEIHHNLAIESSNNNKIFLTPDICVINKNSLEELKDPRYFFSGSRHYYYVKNENLQTFCEVKNYNPFPELLFSFIGMLQELMKEVFINRISNSRPRHIAPSLLISGSGSYHTRLIQKDIMKRFKTNIFFRLFYYKSQIYSNVNMSNIQKIGTR